MCYTYDATYKDRLIGFGEESIGGYDLQGRPTNYRGMSLEWTHGRVSKFTKGGFTQTCTYDVNGIRTEKIENGKTHKYYVEDSQIVREVVTGSENYELYYLYGATGIAGFTLKTANGSTNYYYRKNLLGDVTAIYDAAGVCKAEYAYDAWGNCTVISDMGGIGALNPIRYRGYYWDEEIALYYLNARYYDPEVGRFISQDSIKYIAPETLNGINLFAYCLNNPVMETDPDGTFVLWVSILISIAISLAVEAIQDYREDGELFNDGPNRYLIAGVTGLISGLTGGVTQGLSVGAQFAVTVLSSGGIEVMSETLKGNINSFEDFVKAFAKGAVSGAVSFGLSYGLQYLGGKMKLDKIIGNRNAPNNKINKRLKAAGYGQFKIGRDGYNAILKTIMKEKVFENIFDTTGFVCSFIAGVLPIE